MFRPTITDMQDKYCGDCYDIYFIQSLYKGAACGRYHKGERAAFGRAPTSGCASLPQGRPSVTQDPEVHVTLHCSAHNFSSRID